MFWNFAQINPGRLRFKSGYFYELNKNDNIKKPWQDKLINFFTLFFQKLISISLCFGILPELTFSLQGLKPGIFINSIKIFRKMRIFKKTSAGQAN